MSVKRGGEGFENITQCWKISFPTLPFGPFFGAKIQIYLKSRSKIDSVYFIVLDLFVFSSRGGLVLREIFKHKWKLQYQNFSHLERKCVRQEVHEAVCFHCHASPKGCHRRPKLGHRPKQRKRPIRWWKWPRKCTPLPLPGRTRRPYFKGD